MKTLVTIALSPEAAEALYQTLYNAGQVVGRREVRRANVYLLAKDSEFEVRTTFDQVFPSPYALLIGSVRWSVTTSGYKIAVNDFVCGEIADPILSALTEGLESGTKAYDEAVAVNEALEALDAKAVARGDYRFGKVAYFLTSDDAVAWGNASPGAATVTKLDAGDSFAEAVFAYLKEEGTDISGVDGLYRVVIPTSSPVPA